MVYGIQRKVGGGFVHCAIIVQEYCNRVGNAGGEGLKGGIIRVQQPQSERISCKVQDEARGWGGRKVGS